MKKGALKLELALKIFQQIIEGVDYGHKHFVWYVEFVMFDILLTLFVTILVIEI